MLDLKDICLQVFNIDFNLNLVEDQMVKEVEIDLVDRQKLFYVEIFEEAHTSNRNQVTEKIVEFSKSIQQSLVPGKGKRFEFLIVFQGQLNNYETKYYKDRFPINSRFSFRFYDELELKSRAHKHNILLTNKSRDEKLIPRIEKTNQTNNYWWINTDRSIWNAEKKQIGDIYGYPKSSEQRKRRYLKDINIGDFLISYEKAPSKRLSSIYKTIKVDEDYVYIELILKLKKKLTWNELKDLSSFQKSEVFKMQANGSAYPLNLHFFYELINLSESLEAFREKEFQPLINNPSTIANYNSDTDFGDDYLNFDPDLEAFAKVIASKSFSPPLAVALFGKWGSGKSFFMEKLKERIEILTQLKNNVYCSGVAQIHFNAWSYMDTNLWASIVDRIFSELNVFINKESIEDEEDAIRDKLEKELSLLFNFESTIREKKKEFEKKKVDLINKKKNKEQEIKEKIKSLKSKSFKEALSIIGENSTFQEEIENVVDGQLDILSNEAKSNPELALHEVKSTRTFIYQILKKWTWKRIVFVLVFATLILILPQILIYYEIIRASITISIIQFFAASLTFLIPIIHSFKKAYKVIKPITVSLWKIKNEYDNRSREIVFNTEREVKTLELEVELYKSELKDIDDEISNNQNEIEKIEYKLKKGVASQTLYSFIEKRADNEDYQKHLGLISLIRKDFKKLSRLFVKSKDEQKDTEFLDHFKTPLQRIVLYIDDLDRCPANKVIEVLEAVNLLMAFPLFVVVVGVDPRWVKNALLTEHNNQFSQDSNAHKTIHVLNYLEKIFQVPFHLKEPSDKDVKNMIKNLTYEVVELPEQEDLSEELESEDFNQYTQDEIDNALQGIRVNEGGTKNNLDQYLALKQEEVSLLGMYSTMIGSNPRAIKRFINVYQIIRAHRELKLNIDKVDYDFAIVMFLLALPIGPYKTIYPSFEKFLQDVKNKGTLSSFLEEEREGESQEHKRLKNELVMFFKNIDNEYNFSEDSKIDRINELNQFVRRFTFSELY